MRQLIDDDYLVSEYSPFVFVPNGDISGTGGCDEISCRIGSAEKFAVFSALYADRVYIQLQFITQEHYEFYDVDEIENDDVMYRKYKMNILKDMVIILTYSELIRSKIVFITPTHQMLCPEFKKKRVLGKNSVDIEKIKKEYFARTKVILDDCDRYNETVNIRVKNIDEFFDEEILAALYTTQYCNEQNAKLITNKTSDTMFLALNDGIQEISKMKEYIDIAVFEFYSILFGNVE